MSIGRSSHNPMVDYQTIEYRISKDGKVTETVLNGGANCTEMTLEIERAIGTIESQELLRSDEGEEFLVVENTQIIQP